MPGDGAEDVVEPCENSEQSCKEAAKTPECDRVTQGECSSSSQNSEPEQPSLYHSFVVFALAVFLHYAPQVKLTQVPLLQWKQ